MTQQQGLKRRRDAIGADSDAPKEPSREAKAAWNNDFPAKFDVLEKIGEGSFGTVWLGRRWKQEDERMQQQPSAEVGRREGGDLVAIKRINPTCSPSRILNEFEQMKKLRGGELGVCWICSLRIRCLDCVVALLCSNRVQVLRKAASSAVYSQYPATDFAGRNVVVMRRWHPKALHQCDHPVFHLLDASRYYNKRTVL